MKTKIAISLLALALAGKVCGETAADIGTLPSQKVPATVDENERNPFSTSVPDDIDDIRNFDAESEESRIRQVFSNLKVNGHVPGINGPARVLVGDLILEEGQDVPNVIENQTDVLRVTRIDDKEVELSWVGEEVVEQPRTFVIPIALDPVVSVMLPGRGPQPGGQFVTLNDPGGAGKADAARSSDGRIRSFGGDEDEEDEDEDEEDEDDEELEEGRAEQPRRVSPFGLFR